MVNSVILVGRLAQDPELYITENGKKKSVITLAVPRNYKNIDGEYDTDFLDCILWTGIAESTHEYCKTGDVIGVKGRLQTRMVEKEDGTKQKRVEMIADKVTFLASSNKNKNEEIDSNEKKDKKKKDNS